MTLGDRIVVMKDGLIQQCAPPLEVYDRPLNMFVAGFVGTPPMNFFCGHVDASGDFVIQQADGQPQRLRLPPRLAAVAGAHAGQDLVLGARPEALSPDCAGRFAGGQNKLEARTGVIEPLGDKVDIHFSVGGQDRFVCRTDSTHAELIRPQEAITLYLATDRCHLFLPSQGGRNISL